MEKTELIRLIKQIDPLLASKCIVQKADTRSLPTISLKNTEQYQYVIKIFDDYEMLIVVDAERHRTVEKAGRSSVSLKATWDELPKGESVLRPCYKKLGNRGSKQWEKIWLVGSKYINDFFQNIDLWMLFNREDPEFQGTEDSFQTEDNRIRERCSYKRWKRNQEFRKQVLERFNNKCAICNCDIPDVLEAAHERGHEVSKTNEDDPSHGICLCRIHHRLYDSGLIYIDTETYSVSKEKDSLDNSVWYQRFSQIK